MAGFLSLLGNRAPTGAVAHKCAGEDAIFGAFTSLLSDIGNWTMNDENNRANARLARENNAWAYQLAKENNAWQAEMLKQNQAFSAEEAEKAFQRELKKMQLEMYYNSPVQQIARLRAAGINPSLAFGGANTASVAGASAPQAGNTSSGVTPSLPVLTTPRMEAFRFASPASAMRDIGEALAAVASARRTGVDTEIAEKTMDDVIRSVKADADMKDITITLENEFARGDRTRAQQLADQKIAESVQSIQNLVKQGEYTAARTAIEKVEKLIKDNELSKANIELQYLPQQLDAYIKNVQSSTAHNYAAAANQSSQSRFTDSQNEELQKMMDYNVQLRQNQAQMSQADVMKQGAVLYDEIDYLLGHFENLSERERAELQHVKAAADAAKWNYDMRWINWSLNTIERVNNGITNWIPFAPDKTTITDSNSSFDTNMRTDQNGHIMFNDDRTHRTENERTYVRQRSWH